MFAPLILTDSLTADFCQSTVGGRCGSNACTFIVLYLGYLLLHEKLPPPLGNNLPVEWTHALYWATKKGNNIHDELFEGKGVDVTVKDVIVWQKHNPM